MLLKKFLSFDHKVEFEGEALMQAISQPRLHGIIQDLLQWGTDIQIRQAVTFVGGNGENEAVG